MGVVMSASPTVVRGVVKNGLVVPEGEAKLPEGARVRIVLSPEPLPAELRADFAAWDRAGDEAWAMIDDWELEAGGG